MQNKLKLLAVFSATIEAGSFRGAARALGISPSVVSAHVAALEADTGAALLYRSTRRLSVTPDGEALYACAREMMAAAQRGFDGLALKADALRGSLRISLPALLVGSPVLAAISDFAKQHPDVALNLDFNDQRVNLISDGYDLAIRMGALDDSSLMRRRLCSIPRVLIASTAWLRGRPEPHHPSNLADWDWVAFTARGNDYRFVSASGNDMTLRTQARFAANTAHGVAELVRLGHGLGVVAENVVAAGLADGHLSRVLPEWSLGEIETFAIWHPNAPRTGLTQRLVKHLTRSLTA